MIGTHPQLMPWMADANSQYDVAASEPWNRMITVQGVASPHVSAGLSEEDILDLPEDADILKKVTSEVQSTLAAI